MTFELNIKTSEMYYSSINIVLIKINFFIFKIAFLYLCAYYIYFLKSVSKTFIFIINHYILLNYIPISFTHILITICLFFVHSRLMCILIHEEV